MRAGGVEDGLGVLGGLAGCGYVSNMDHASNHGFMVREEAECGGARGPRRNIACCRWLCVKRL